MTTEQQLREALKELLSAHENLYKANFGQLANPEDDIAAKPARIALALPAQRPDDERVSVQAIAEELANADLDDPGSEDWKNYKHMAQAIRPYLRAKPDAGVALSNTTIEFQGECTSDNTNASIARQHTCAGADIEKALQNAAQILLRVQTENNRTKLDEWEACYAMLFTQMNEVVAENVRLKSAGAGKGVVAEEAIIEAIANDICDTVNALNGEAYKPMQWMGAARRAYTHAIAALAQSKAPDGSAG